MKNPVLSFVIRLGALLATLSFAACESDETEKAYSHYESELRDLEKDKYEDRLDRLDDEVDMMEYEHHLEERDRRRSAMDERMDRSWESRTGW